MTFDANTTTQAAPSPYGAPRSYLWRTTEEAILTAHYRTSGPRHCAALLPHRGLHSIYAKARTMGLQAPKTPTTQGKRFARRYPQCDRVDAAIREAYCSPMRGAILKAAHEVGRPAWWVHKRAVELGCSRNVRNRVDAWTAPELAILEQYATCQPKLIAKRLAQQGFARTPTAVVVMLRRRGIDRTDPDRFIPSDVARMLGVNPKTVTDWIDRRGLKAVKVDHGPFGRFEIKRRALRDWIASHRRYVDLRRVDQVWFMDLVFGEAA